MTKKNIIDLIKHLEKFGLNDSHIMHNSDIIADDFIESQNLISESSDDWEMCEDCNTCTNCLKADACLCP